MNSPPENPEFVQETQPATVPVPILDGVVAPPPVPPRYPPWTVLDILAIPLLVIVGIFAMGILVTAMLPGPTFQQKLTRFANLPELALAVQAVVYLLLLGCMYLILGARTGGAPFWKSIHWNWPASIWLYVFIGLMMQGVFLFVERFLPFPKNTPFEAILQRRYAIVGVSIFSITLGPLIEELFFRGFLYPFLRRYLGIIAAIIATALPFGLLHAAQYGYSWASVLLVSIVGVVLAVVREKKDSLASSFLVHVAYNGVIVVILFIGTNGFRHLEKLNAQ